MAKQIDLTALPKHVGIIMDGNGRWAKKFFLTRKAGHTAGVQTLRKISEQMNEMGFEVMTVYAFSTENWSRSEEEVADLMNLLRDYIQQYIKDTKKNNMRITVIGDITRLDADLQDRIKYLTELTKNNAGMRVNIAINYGGRDEIVRAVKKISAEISDKKHRIDEIDEDFFEKYLDTADLPDPDLLIRTSGEMRISNFLLWQMAYTEFYFCDKLWPDFSKDDLLEAVYFYQNRDRRYGGRQ